MTHSIKTTLSAAILAATLISAPALAADYPTDFPALDTDSNGQVSFAEFSKAVKANGVTRTAAAQQFTRLSAGDAVITEEEFNLGLAFQDQPYALQAITGNQSNISFAASEVDMTSPELEPQVTEVQDSPVADSEPIIVEDSAPIEAAPSESIEIITEPVPETLAPTTTSTEPEIKIELQEPEVPVIDIPEVESVEPEAVDILEDEVEPLPEG